MLISAGGGLMLLGAVVLFVFRSKLCGAANAAAPQKSGAETIDVTVTVVIGCHNEGDHLAANLPKILNQRGVNFEVVVVDDCSSDSTPDVLKRLENDYKNLRHTFVPRTARYVSHEKLSVSLGVRAARGSIVVLTRPSCAPLTDIWLKTIASAFDPDTDIVVGYANYADNGSAAARRAIYERMRYSLVWLLSTRGRAAGADGGNMAFRREAFLAADGYADSLDRLFGVDDLLVRAMARRGNAAACTVPAATVRDFGGNLRRVWRSERLQRAASFAYAPRRGSAAVIAMNLTTWGIYLWIIGAAVAAATFALLKLWWAVGIVVVLSVALACADVAIVRCTEARLRERRRGLIIVWYELTRPFSCLLWKLRAYAHRHDFARKI